MVSKFQAFEKKKLPPLVISWDVTTSLTKRKKNMEVKNANQKSFLLEQGNRNDHCVGVTALRLFLNKYSHPQSPFSELLSPSLLGISLV